MTQRDPYILNLSELDTVALTVWAEARGEPVVGQTAVAHVIRTRYENPCWWSRERGDGVNDDTLKAVCLDPKQFSCWNPGQPAYERLINPATLFRPDLKAIRLICSAVLSSTTADDDPTNGADHYCTRAVAPHTEWAKGRTPIAKIGDHWFYRLRKS
jgi:N-acetylmuramoyl-L-alanine amidase